MTATAPTRPALPPTDHQPRPYTGLAKAEVLALRKQFASPAIFTLYREPLMIVEGHMQYLYDETGRRYLDLFAGIVTVSDVDDSSPHTPHMTVSVPFSAPICDPVRRRRQL